MREEVPAQIIEKKSYLNLVFVNNFSEPYLGGGEKQLLMLTRGFVSKGHKVTIVCAEGSGLAKEAREAGAAIVETTFSLMQIKKTLGVISNVIKETVGKSELPCTLSGTGYYTNILVRMVHVPEEVKIVNIHRTLADAAAQESKNIGMRLFVDKLRRERIDGHVAVSQAVKRSFVKTGIPEQEIAVIYNGVQSPEREIPLCSKHGETIGFFGRLEPVKGPDIFLRAAIEIAQRCPSAQFRIAGEGSMRASLEKQVKESGLAKKCNFVGYQNPYDFLPTIDILLVPSRSEAFSTAIAEAQISKVFVVASDVGGIPEALCSPVTSRTFETGNIEDLVSSVFEIEKDWDKGWEMLSTVALEVEERFQPEATVRGYLDFFQELHE